MSCFPCGSSQMSKALKRVNSKVRQPPSPSSLLPKRQSHLDNQEPNIAEIAKSKNDIKSQIFTFQELADATDNFCPECLVDYNSFGKVYRGKLNESGMIVAVVHLDRNGSRGHREFLVEVLMLSVLHHPNLINFIGYCTERDDRFLVHEYLPFGSLDQHLHGSSSQKKPLDWYTRMKIALGIAKGLEFIHQAKPPVIHRNLKPSKILLDSYFNPKLSDFGLAKLGPSEDKAHVSTKVMGTHGYIAPEYEKRGLLTLKTDVYSFGVVLLELVTGRRAVDFTRCTQEQNLVSWAHHILKDPKKFPELADPLLKGEFPAKCFNQALAVAAMCLQEEETARPMMTDVVTALMHLPLADLDNNISSPPSEPCPKHDNLIDGANEFHHVEDSVKEHQQVATEN